MPMFTYQAFGLNIASEIECPELLPGKEGTPDIHVHYGSVPEQLENPIAQRILYQVSAGRYLLKLDGIARYMVCNGNEIVIEPAPEADEDAIRLFLLRPAFGALLHQRGILCLHGSAIATPKGAVLFVGPSGCGKSTLAGAFHQRRYRVLADDLCAITDVVGKPFVLPAYPRLLLWADAVDELVLAKANLRPARPGLEKFQLALGQDFAADAVPIYAVYFLSLGNKRELSPNTLQGVGKTLALIANTYQAHFLKEITLGAHQFRQIGAIAQHTRMAGIVRPWGGSRIEGLADFLERDFTL